MRIKVNINVIYGNDKKIHCDNNLYRLSRGVIFIFHLKELKTMETCKVRGKNQELKHYSML